MRPPSLAIKDLVAGYGETVVLDGISLDLAPRGTLALLGRNGVGKTTLISTIMGHTTRHAGTLTHEGSEITTLPPHARARGGIGWVPQERDIFRSLTVTENLTVAARGRRPRRWTLERVFELFPRLAERRRHYGNQLSGGEQQMLSLGRALMMDPTLLLLDEPLEGLAPVIVDLVLAAIDRLKREDDLSILLVEQHATLALGFAERAIILDRGRIVYEGESAALLATPDRLARLMGVARA
ncbi:MAG TPA: ABC transporter ATP-binding protein [Stellaceae bacterium]|nr:ABC transporter ATP-binding protein [Stellaceae bacterium]